jgi:alpha-N-arabinofuranosidase
MSEWNVWSGLDWRNGLYAGGMLTMFERQGSYMHIAGPALFLRHASANDWNNALVNFNNFNWFPAPNYVMMKFWRDHYAPNFLATDGSNSDLNISTTRTESGQEIYFKIINTSSRDYPVQLEIDGSFQLRAAILEQIAPGSLSASNTMANPDNLHVEKGNAEIDSGRVHITIPRYSGTIVTLSQDPNAGIIDDHSINMIKDYRLYPNYPNPFNPRTAIRYELPKTEHVTLRVVDIMGRKITVLVNDVKKEGCYVSEWRGINENGLPVSSGVYFYELVTTSHKIVRKMVLIR